MDLIPIVTIDRRVCETLEVGYGWGRLQFSADKNPHLAKAFWG